MTKIHAYDIVLSAVFILLGCGLGWWIIYELIDPQLAKHFFYGAFAVGSALLYVQTLLAVKARQRLVPELLLFAGLYVATAWTALCIAVPLMFFYDLSNYAKLAAALAIIFFCTVNVRIALRSAKDIWDRYGAFAFTNHLNASKSSVKWEKVANAMRPHVKVTAVGIPPRWSSVCINIMYAFAVAGLYLAGLYSVFAVVSWAVPATITAGMLLQHASHRLFQAYSVWVWQRDNGTVIRSTGVSAKKKSK